MSSFFIFEGHVSSRKPFRIEVIAADYEAAEEYAKDLLDDPDEMESHVTGDGEHEVDIDTYEELIISRF